MSSRIDQVFQKTRSESRTALIPYICAGDPTPEATLPLMHALVEAGADVIELGVPFSDPMADGPVIQHASERAIAQGMSLKNVLEIVTQFRQTNQTTPVVLMGYANPIEVMGHQQFATSAQKAGVDGVLIVDYPPEEYGEFAQQLSDSQIAPIFLLAPTSTVERIQQVAAIAKGYLYYVSLRGVTGSSALNVTDVEQRVQTIKQYCKIPVGVGFGISDAQSAARIGAVADAVVIGSKLIQTIQESIAGVGNSSETAVQAAKTWLSGIRTALDSLPKKES